MTAGRISLYLSASCDHGQITQIPGPKVISLVRGNGYLMGISDIKMVSFIGADIGRWAIGTIALWEIKITRARFRWVRYDHGNPERYSTQNSSNILTDFLDKFRPTLELF